MRWLPWIALIFFLSPAAAVHVGTSEIQWACGFRSGHPDRCGIDPVGGGEAVQSEGEPKFSAADWLEDDARVMGLAVGDDARAYPIRMFNAHEIVNDEVGGVKVAVTFCPLCGSGVVFERMVAIDGQLTELNFTASGFLWKHDMVMWDPETSTLWTQIQGVPIAILDDGVKPEHPDWRLAPIPSSLTTWGAWKSSHPDTLLLQPVFSPGSYREYAYGDYEQASNCRFGISSQRNCDVEGLHPKEQVVATEHPAGGLAFPILGVQQAGAAFMQVNGVGYVATAEFGGASRIYTTNHTFTMDPSGLWLDENDALWDLRTAARADGGETLEPVDSLVLFWFAWNEHLPDTDVWRPADGSLLEPTQTTPAGLFIAVFALFGALAVRRR